MTDEREMAVEQTSPDDLINEAKLQYIQNRMSVPKDTHNNYSDFDYKTLNSMLLRLKPLLEATGSLLLIDDEVRQVGERFYVVATATLVDADTGNEIRSAHGWAREAEHEAKKSDSQVTGSASTYARKSAVAALFLIDDGDDPDAENNAKNEATAKDMLRGRLKNSRVPPKAFDAATQAMTNGNVKTWGELSETFASHILNNDWNVYIGRLKSAGIVK